MLFAGNPLSPPRRPRKRADAVVCGVPFRWDANVVEYFGGILEVEYPSTRLAWIQVGDDVPGYEHRETGLLLNRLPFRGGDLWLVSIPAPFRSPERLMEHVATCRPGRGFRKLRDKTALVMPLVRIPAHRRNKRFLLPPNLDPDREDGTGEPHLSFRQAMPPFVLFSDGAGPRRGWALQLTAEDLVLV